MPRMTPSKALGYAVGVFENTIRHTGNPCRTHPVPMEHYRDIKARYENIFRGHLLEWYDQRLIDQIDRMVAKAAVRFPSEIKARDYVEGQVMADIHMARELARAQRSRNARLAVAEREKRKKSRRSARWAVLDD